MRKISWVIIVAMLTLSSTAFADAYYYFTCNATSWNLSDDSRLVPIDQGHMALDYEVTQEWMVQSGDSCAIVETDELNGWGSGPLFFTTVIYGYPMVYAVDVDVPGQVNITSESTSQFRVYYPETGDYRIKIYTHGAPSIEIVQL